jgi:uncharacterized membrane protein YcaP (DUF421 family)
MDWASQIFFAKGDELDIPQALIRAAIVFAFTLILFRLAKKRFIGKSTPFDTVMSVVVGSVISRAVNGSATLFPTLAISALIAFLHGVISFFMSRSPWFGRLIEGVPRQVMKDGKIDKKVLDEEHLTVADILSSARIQSELESLDKVADSFLETNGKVSIIPKEKKK